MVDTNFLSLLDNIVYIVKKNIKGLNITIAEEKGINYYLFYPCSELKAHRIF